VAFLGHAVAMSRPARFLVSRSNLRETRLESGGDVADATRALAAGEARLAVGPFALTANNVSYAKTGDQLGYWRFFPAPQGWGCIPVWGFADVVESRAEGGGVGERFYGDQPLAAHHRNPPTKVSKGTIVDGTAHRRELPAIYNQLIRCAEDPAYRPEREGLQALLKPLFATAFLIDDFFAEKDFFGAGQVLLSSASSKTAYATAFCLAQRPGVARPRLVGLTSAANVEFTRALGCYDQVVTYDAINSLPAVPAIYTDYSGDAVVRRAVHEHFGEALQHDCAVGATHWQSRGSAQDLPGPRPEFFFAPTRAAKRGGPPPEGWGPGGLYQRMGEAWNAFMKPVAESTTPWLRVVTGQGPEAVRLLYTRLLDGSVPAIEGHVLTL
jgi:hypothetical protein